MDFEEKRNSLGIMRFCESTKRSWLQMAQAIPLFDYQVGCFNALYSQRQPIFPSRGRNHRYKTVVMYRGESSRGDPSPVGDDARVSVAHTVNLVRAESVVESDPRFQIEKSKGPYQAGLWIELTVQVSQEGLFSRWDKSRDGSFQLALLWIFGTRSYPHLLHLDVGRCWMSSTAPPLGQLLRAFHDCTDLSFSIPVLFVNRGMCWMSASAGPPAGQFSLAMTFRISGDIDKYHGKYLALVVGVPESIRKQGVVPEFSKAWFTRA